MLSVVERTALSRSLCPRKYAAAMYADPHTTTMIPKLPASRLVRRLRFGNHFFIAAPITVLRSSRGPQGEARHAAAQVDRHSVQLVGRQARLTERIHRLLRRLAELGEGLRNLFGAAG